MTKTEHWKVNPVEADYDAACRYLSLRIPLDRARALADGFQDAPFVSHRANDLLRASGLPLLPEDDPEVANDLKKVRNGTKLAPVLLVRRNLLETPLTVADGYHRICASYHLDEDAEIPCRIVDFAVEGVAGPV